VKLKISSETVVALVLGIAGGVLFFYSTKALHAHFDYTFEIAGALLRGHVGLDASPGSWLNELVPWKGKFYSVFPLGAVLTQIPVALLHKMALIRFWPAQETASVVAGCCVYFCYRLTYVARMTQPRRILLALFPVFATFTWTNLGFAGAWQVALGFSLLGQSAALYFTLVRPRPILAGAFLALAFGNRVELVLVTPIFLYFWFFRMDQIRPASVPAESAPVPEPEPAPVTPLPNELIETDPAPSDFAPAAVADAPATTSNVIEAEPVPVDTVSEAPISSDTTSLDSTPVAPVSPEPAPATPEPTPATEPAPVWHKQYHPALIRTAKFLAIPALMLLAMAAYNYSRFHSVADFGYARIPGVLNEPWYRHGLFSFYSIPWNIHKMLFDGAADMPVFPYIRFYPFGCSIFISSPFLFMLFREGGKYRLPCWLAIAGLTMVLWLHGNPGGWQFSYRYAMIMLPWMFLLITGNGPRRLTATETALFLVSVGLNWLANWEFLFTNIVHP
jgi:hypothetical protein